jgi:hypothetical protein
MFSTTDFLVSSQSRRLSFKTSSFLLHIRAAVEHNS